LPRNKFECFTWDLFLAKELFALPHGDELTLIYTGIM